MQVRLLKREMEFFKVVPLDSSLIDGAKDTIKVDRLIGVLSERKGVAPISNQKLASVDYQLYDLKPGSYVVVTGGCSDRERIYLSYRKLVVFSSQNPGYMTEPSQEIFLDFPCSELTKTFRH